jgi:TRAP-type C4-dicarboxylate transport system permease small subunit
MTPSPAERAMAPVEQVARIQLMVAMAALLVMGAVTCADVFLKYVFNRPILGAYDLVESLLPVVIFYGLPGMLLRRKAIVIDLIDHVLTWRGLRMLNVLTDVSVLALLIGMTAAFVSPAWLAFDYGDRKIELGLPLWLIWAVVIIGMIGTVLAAATNVVRAVRAEGSEAS